MTEFEQILNNGNRTEIRDYVCAKRITAYSIQSKNQDVIVVAHVKDAIRKARTICRDKKQQVTIVLHSPFDFWHEIIHVHYGDKKLKWFYCHVDYLDCKGKY